MTPTLPETDAAAVRSLIRFREAAYFCLAQPAHKVRGGSNELDNLQLLCRTCNRSKGDR